MAMFLVSGNVDIPDSGNIYVGGSHVIKCHPKFPFLFHVPIPSWEHGC